MASRHFTPGTDESSGLKQHQCEYCEKSFYLKGDYTRHVRVHTGETFYKCDICGRGFKQKGAMVRHRFLHMNVDFKI